MGLWSYWSDVLIANNVVHRCGEGIVVSSDIRGPSTVSATRNGRTCAWQRPATT